MKRNVKMGMFPRFDIGDNCWVIKRDVNEEWIISREKITGVEIRGAISDKEYDYAYITGRYYHECFVFDNAIDAVECYTELNSFIENAGLKPRGNLLSSINKGYLDRLSKANELVNKFMLERYIRHYE